MGPESHIKAVACLPSVVGWWMKKELGLLDDFLWT